MVPGTGTLRSSYGTGFNAGMGASIATNVEVHARPAVREGMKGMNVAGGPGKPGTGAMGPDRRVKDRSYYLGILRSKIGELTAELERLRSQEDSLNKNQAVTQQLQQSLKKVQEEIGRMKTTLSDLNFTLEKHGNGGFDHEAAIEESSQYRAQNEAQKKENDKIFVKAKEEEKQCRTLEGQLQHQMAVLDQRLSVDPEKAEAYRRLRDENFAVTDAISSARHEIAVLTERHDTLLKELKKDVDKHRAFEVQKEILRKRRLKEALEKECSVSLEDEGKSLLMLVRSTTGEIEAIGRQTEETREEIEKRQETLAKIDAELNEYQGENVKRYAELQEKDREMQEFIDTFASQERTESENVKQNEARVVALLEQISLNMKYQEDLMKETNATTRLQALRDALDVKGKEADNSMSTYERLIQELESRKSELEKVASLDEKLSVELAAMTQRIEEQQSEIVRFSDIDTLRRDIEANKKQLLERKAYLQKRRDAVRQHVTGLNAMHDARKEELASSDIHDALVKQEQRMRVVLQSTFQLEDFVRAKERETAYLPLKAEALRAVEELNNHLRDQKRQDTMSSMNMTGGLGGGAQTMKF
jgi:intraflagellar transport protein 74